ncbi:hypothetical protein STIUS_v1c03800 [Spiroplasma sp. TIUS-1]|uniref:hypothetical protein n=1 Tax=Spiroplasma sp. TIUS-1 TaxID=216963 RepID=UPI0013970B00|nr:hypothetical protein [Spiroplasma sp. TIUS-1]QHX35934.1 hypothetical protein STIUS_v1c03800 [Spiroplasma sp. TIUS-1]
MPKLRTSELISIWENRFDSVDSKGLCPNCKNKNWLIEFDEYSLNISDPNHFWVVKDIDGVENNSEVNMSNMWPAHKKCIAIIK